MTADHKLIVGLDEVRGVVLKCAREGCLARVIVSPDQLDTLPDNCPRGHLWDWTNPHKQFSGSPFRLWLSLLEMMRNPLTKDAGFKILLEFDEPR